MVLEEKGYKLPNKIGRMGSGDPSKEKENQR
jgi:hypothetical protein